MPSRCASSAVPTSATRTGSAKSGRRDTKPSPQTPARQDPAAPFPVVFIPYTPLEGFPDLPPMALDRSARHAVPLRVRPTSCPPADLGNRPVRRRRNASAALAVCQPLEAFLVVAHLGPVAENPDLHAPGARRLRAGRCIHDRHDRLMLARQVNPARSREQFRGCRSFARPLNRKPAGPRLATGCARKRIGSRT